jgi:hypothetical protein
MRVTTKAVYDIESGQLLEWEGHEYDGPVALCGGGPSSEQKQAASSQAALTSQTAALADKQQAREEDQYNQIKPYAFDRLQNGLPFFGAMTDAASGLNAQAFAPARAALTKRLDSFGSLPSGYREQALTDLDAQQARAFDSSLLSNLLTNEQSKSEAARLITGQQQIANPLGYYNSSISGNQSIMNAPLQSTGVGGLLGGLAGGAMSAIKF